MDTSRMKNMVVLRDLPSNIIDEAIIILKPNISEAILRRISKFVTDVENKEERLRNESQEF